MSIAQLPTLMVAPAQVVRGRGSLMQSAPLLSRFGQRPLIVGGKQTLAVTLPFLQPALSKLVPSLATYEADCSESTLADLHQRVSAHQADFIIGIGGGKALDTAKLLAYQAQLPVVTIPSSAATCAAWTALSNVYTEAGAFLYDVGLQRCPDLLLLDYELIATAAQRTLVSGIGDALAKWYEAAVSSGSSDQTLVIAAVQQARVLRDILFQKAEIALQTPGSLVWQEVVDATILMAGVIGGLGGAQCRTVAAHAVHNGLTQLRSSHGTLHGEKVAYGILVQLRLEEMSSQSGLAITARQQLLQFYTAIGLPKTLEDLGMGNIGLGELRAAATFACRDGSDIHHLPFRVSPEQLMAAMISTTVTDSYRSQLPEGWPEGRPQDGPQDGSQDGPQDCTQEVMM